MLEIIATFPLDYLYYATGNYNNWLRLLRLLKAGRLLDADTLFKAYFESLHLYNVVRLFVVYLLSSHVFSCILFAIAKHEHDSGGRFDGGYLVWIRVITSQI